MPGTGQRAGDSFPFELGHGGVASQLQEVGEGKLELERVCSTLYRLVRRGVSKNVIIK